MGSAVAAPGLYSTGSKLWCMGLVALRRGNRPGLGTDPVSPALAGRFLTPEPRGKPSLRVWKPCVTEGMHAELLYSCPTLRPYGLQPAKLFCPWDAPGRNTGAGCHALLQGDLPDPGIKPASPAPPALQVDPLPPSHRRSRHCVSTSLQNRLSLGQGADV